MVPKEFEINSRDDLQTVLNKISVQDIKYSLNKEYNGYNSIEYQLQKICLTNEELDENKFKKLCKKFNNLGIDVSQVSNISLDENAKKIIETYILNNYGDNFYKLEGSQQRAIMISLCEYIFDNHSLISNWILHFIHVISSNDIDKKYFEGDDLVSFCAYPSLLIIKAYHLLYRLQYDEFEEINYNLINFDFNRDDFYFYEGNLNGIVATNFVKSFNKLQNKRPDLNSAAINNKIICDIIRDSLAHGNIDVFFALNNGKLEHIIEFQDIYRNDVRGIQMSIDKFNQFLQSDAFLPKYAYTKVNNFGRNI